MTPLTKFDARTFWLLLAVGASILAVIGCTPQPKSGFATDDESVTTVTVRPDTLNITAIGTPAFGEEIARQWAAERDGKLNITHVSLEDFLEADSTQGSEQSEQDAKRTDLFVHPSRILADLISRDLIRVYPRDGLASAEMNMDSCLTHFRKVGVRHRDETWSVSLGGRQLRLFYRRDVLDAAGIAVPKTWEQLVRSLEKLQQSESTKDLLPIVLPSGEGEAASLYLARLSSELRDRGKLTFFFDRRTMEPTLEAPVFAKALRELKDYLQLSQSDLSVSDAFETFADGRAVFAIALPQLGDQFDRGKLETASSNWGVTRLPGSEKTFDIREALWRNRQSGSQQKIDMLGLKSNSISIANRSSHASDSVEFVTWITEKQNSRKLLPKVAAPFRATHLGRVGDWCSLPEASNQFLNALADSIEETHRSAMVLTFPMLPGTERYLKVLDTELRKSLSHKDADPQETLRQIATQWEAITESLGREDQIRELKRGNGT